MMDERHFCGIKEYKEMDEVEVQKNNREYESEVKEIVKVRLMEIMLRWLRICTLR